MRATNKRIRHKYRHNFHILSRIPKHVSDLMYTTLG